MFGRQPVKPGLKHFKSSSLPCKHGSQILRSYKRTQQGSTGRPTLATPQRASSLLCSVSRLPSALVWALADLQGKVHVHTAHRKQALWRMSLPSGRSPGRDFVVSGGADEMDRPFALQATGSDSDCTPAFSSQSAGPPQLVAMLEKLRNAPLDSRAQLRVVDEPKQASGALHDRTSEITASARDEAFTNYDAGVEAEVWAVFDPTPVENPDPGYMFVSVPFGRAHAAWPTGEALMTGLTVDIAITPVNGLVLERRSYVDGIQFALRVYPMESLLALPGQHSVAVRGRGASSSYASSSFEL
ncbi:hypothetical protein WJX73_008727 [Symbiochloris irregularis]|uniref:Uncharacterized protein n=1 Tax=Symbiochloris irregularis TaxID=706552 RepID=A0AAW1PYR7_9CHLO